MISNNLKKVLAAAAISATFASVAMAQTDGGGPGSGGGFGGSVAPLGLPGTPAGGGTTGRGTLSGPGLSGLAGARANFLNSAAAGLMIPNPAGGQVNVPQPVARALGAVLGGNATPAQLSAVGGALTGVPAASATALTNALTAFGRSANFATLSAAVSAYNNAVNALPAGATPSPALLAIRNALQAASRQ
jgi:hypothetical protein